MKRFVLPALALVGLGCGQRPDPPPSTEKALRIAVSFPASARAEPASGRVLLMLSRQGAVEPRQNVRLFDLDPIYAIDVDGLAPGDEVVFQPSAFERPDALAFPKRLDRLEPGTYHAQAVIDIDDTWRSYNDAPGNLYSRPVKVELARRHGGAYELIADQIVEPKTHEDTDWVEFVSIRSELLSAFHGREVRLRAAVVLPFGYAEEADRRYPAVYRIPGFSGRHHYVLRRPKRNPERWERWTSGTSRFRGFEIVLDPDVPTGHSVFANSANNGPVGDALVDELIPEIDRRFRTIPDARARFVAGHSSGGWSSLWLQIAYPDRFGGCWSTAPDPVDFRHFQTVDIYRDRNAHWFDTGYPRPVARTRHAVALTVVALNQWERVIGPGGQLSSFDAVFGPRGDDGAPVPLVDQLTGAIDHAVADYWRQYDIHAILRARWPELGPKLRGKLRIVAAAWDSFYLEPAVEQLAAFLDTTNHGGYVDIVPGDHGSFLTDELWRRFDREMAEQFERGQAGGAEPTPAAPPAP